VRKKRYFYAHTLLDGTPFEYRGRPIPILKGRVLAAGFLALWFVSTNYVLELLLPAIVVAAVAAPWVLVRTAAFNARSTAYRNMTFDFRASYTDAFKTLTWGGVVTVVTLGIGYPFLHHRLSKFLVERLRFGGIPGSFHGLAGRYFRAYFAAGFTAALVTLGAILLTPRIPRTSPTAALILTSLPVYAGYLVSFVLLQARITNYVWNQRELGPLVFDARLRAKELIVLYLTNTLAIVGSLGLLIPWATVRMARYRASRLRVACYGKLAEFRGTAQPAGSAAGAEVADLFEFDVSI